MAESGRDIQGHGPAGLYHEAIVKVAHRGCGSGRLETPDASVSIDNPLCGDRVTMDVQMGDGYLRGVAHQVRGCLLCEAAASVIAANAVGETVAELLAVEEALRGALAGGFNGRHMPWQDLAMFAPVAGYRSRHRCVTLAFEALASAMALALDEPGKGG